MARGSGTGLSGGALPHADGVLIVTSRMRDILEVAPEDQRAVVEPGVINLHVTRAAAPHGYYYAPDPSSQQVCSIGGNVAENSGGAHCLKYGFTTNHVLGVELVTPDGEVVELGGRAPDAPGYDLLGAFVGSEGTLGIATEVTVRLTRLPEAVRTLLAGFASTDEAGAAVSAIIAAGVVPAAIEMMDALAIEAAEAAVHCGYPAGAGRGADRRAGRAGGRGGARSSPRSSGSAGSNGAFEIRIAADDAERALFWKGRKSAFAAVGRISPDYIVQDGVIPRTALPEVLRAHRASCRPSRGMRVANVFHAGDGNLHPLVLFDDAVARAGRARPRRSSGAILDLCIEHGGSITGEHGVGSTRPSTCRACSPTTTSTPCSWCAARSTRPGCPTRARSSRRRGCAARSPAGKGAHPLVEAGLAEAVLMTPTGLDASAPMRSLPDDASPRPHRRPRRDDARSRGRRRRRGRRGPSPARRFVAARRGSTEEAAAVLRRGRRARLAVVARGGGTKLDWGTAAAPARPDRRHPPAGPGGRARGRRPDRRGPAPVTRWPRWPSGCAGAGQRLAAGRAGARHHHRRHARHRRWRAPADAGRRRPRPAHRRHLVRADGVVAQAGGKVVKNVAGYDLAKLVTGAYGTLGLVTEAAFRLHPLPAAAAYVTLRVGDPARRTGGRQRALHAQFVPAAIEVDRPDGGPVEVAVLLEGTPAGVAARAEAARRLLGADTTVADPSLRAARSATVVSAPSSRRAASAPATPAGVPSSSTVTAAGPPTGTSTSSAAGTSCAARTVAASRPACAGSPTRRVTYAAAAGSGCSRNAHSVTSPSVPYAPVNSLPRS